MTDPNLGLPLLSLLLFTLPAGAALIWLVPDPTRARWIALGTALVDLALSLVALARFDPANGDFQLIERYSWIPSLNVHYSLGVDGISVAFLPFTVLLVIGVILASWTSVRTMPRLYYSLLLVLESTTLGVFLALDTVLFFLFWELTLIPIFFLVSLWGIGPNRRFAAVKYTLFMLVAGVPLLFAFILLAFNHAGDGRGRGPGRAVLRLPDPARDPAPRQPGADGLPAAAGRFRGQDPGLPAAHLAAGGGLRWARERRRPDDGAQARGLWADPLRGAPGPGRGHGPALAARGARGGGHPLRGPGGPGPDQPAPDAGLLQHQPRRAGGARVSPRSAWRGCRGPSSSCSTSAWWRGGSSSSPASCTTAPGLRNWRAWAG